MIENVQIDEQALVIKHTMMTLKEADVLKRDIDDENCDFTGLVGKKPGHGFFFCKLDIDPISLKQIARNARVIFDEEKEKGADGCHTTIFQKINKTADGGCQESSGDGLRSQATFSVLDEYQTREMDLATKLGVHPKPIFEYISTRLENLTHHDVDRVVTDINLIQSEAGCEPQAFHTDFDPKLKYDKDSPPASLLVNFGSDDLFLDMKDENSDTVTKLTVKPGWLLYFGGFVQHRGCGYATQNLRLHACIQSGRR